MAQIFAWFLNWVFYLYFAFNKNELIFRKLLLRIHFNEAVFSMEKVNSYHSYSIFLEFFLRFYLSMEYLFFHCLSYYLFSFWMLVCLISIYFIFLLFQLHSFVHLTVDYSFMSFSCYSMNSLNYNRNYTCRYYSLFGIVNDFV